MKVSKETQVGALTAIGITLLVLGYNYLSGRDDLFYTGKTFYAVYQNVDGLTGSNPVMYSGVRIGSVESVDLDVNTLSTTVTLDISKKGFRMPKGSTARIEDESMLGGKMVVIKLGESKEEAVTGDTLIGVTGVGIASSVTDVLEPLATKLNNILGSLDTLTANGQLEASLKELPSTILALKTTLKTTNSAISNASPQLSELLKNANTLVSSLNENKEALANSMSNLEKITDEMAKVQLQETMANTSKALKEFSITLDNINQGKGSLGKLAKDETLYNNLSKATMDLDKLLLDIKKYPDKYLAIPFTKRRQNKAKDASSKDPDVN